MFFPSKRALLYFLGLTFLANSWTWKQDAHDHLLHLYLGLRGFCGYMVYFVGLLGAFLSNSSSFKLLNWRLIAIMYICTLFNAVWAVYVAIRYFFLAYKWLFFQNRRLENRRLIAKYQLHLFLGLRGFCTVYFLGLIFLKNSLKYKYYICIQLSQELNICHTIFDSSRGGACSEEGCLLWIQFLLNTMTST